MAQTTCEESKFGPFRLDWQELRPLGVVRVSRYNGLDSSCCSLFCSQLCWLSVLGQSVTETSKLHLEEVKGSQTCPRFAKKLASLRRPRLQIGSDKGRKHAPCVTSCGQYLALFQLLL